MRSWWVWHLEKSGTTVYWSIKASIKRQQRSHERRGLNDHGIHKRVGHSSAVVDLRISPGLHSHRVARAGLGCPCRRPHRRLGGGLDISQRELGDQTQGVPDSRSLHPRRRLPSHVHAPLLARRRGPSNTRGEGEAGAGPTRLEAKERIRVCGSEINPGFIGSIGAKRQSVHRTAS